MVYNLISVKSVIAKVMSELNIEEGNVRITDMIEWAGSALKKIGGFTSLNNKITGKEGIPLIRIENYQAQLPRDCNSVIQVAYADSVTADQFYPMKYSTGTLEARTWLTKDMDEYTSSSSTVSTALSINELVTFTAELFDESYADALSRLNSDADLQSIIENMVGAYESNNEGYNTTNEYQLEYKIVPGYIKTNIRDGYLMVSYLSIPTDSDGYPMIPDDESFKEAIFWYINMKLTYIDWRAGKITKDVYYDAKNTWNFYVKQAYGKAIMPASLDELESIKNVWVRLIPSMGASNSFYKYIDQEEQIKTFS